MYYYYNCNELYHHGIRGQKWGVRRFQNHDGTYTSAGKRRRNSENRGASPPRAKSGVGKKIATGLAIGAAAGLAAYGLSKVDTRKISDAIWTRKMTAPSVPKLREFTVSPKVKEFVEKNGQKALGVLKESAKRGGKAMADAAIASIGAIAVAKITSKISSKVNTGNTDLDKVIKDTTSAGVNAAFNTRSYSSGNKYKSGPIDRAKGAEISKIVGPPKQKEIDRSGPEYQALFKNQNGEQRDPDTRGLIKSMASAGYGVDQISTYLDKLDKGEIRHSMLPSELCHHGIKGQKWGIRRFRNSDGSLTAAGKRRRAENYSDEQMMRDRRIYSKGAARRINKRMLRGESVSGARSAEADRIARYRKVSENAGHVGSVVGSIAGGVAGGLVGLKLSGNTKVHSALRNLGLNDTNIAVLSVTASGAIATGLGAVGKSLGSIGGQSAAMLVGGYSPSKYRR